MDFSDKSNDDLAKIIGAGLKEAESRMAAANVAHRTIRRFKAGHAIIADAASDLTTMAGGIHTDSVDTTK